MASNWRTKKALYEIHEVYKNRTEVYHLMATGEEVSKWCKSHNEMNGFIPGVGGDKHYNCWAVLVTEYIG